MISEKEKAFPLPKDPPAWQDKKRECLGLFKQGPLETLDEFAQRVTRESNLALSRLRQRKAEPRRKSLLRRLAALLRW